MLKFKKARRSGLSLVELLIAVGVLAVTMMSLVSFFVATTRMTEESRNLSLAVSHAQSVLEDIRAFGYSGVDTAITSGNWNWDQSALIARGMGALKAEAIYTTYSGSGLLTVNVAVQWQDTQNAVRRTYLATALGGS